MNPKYKAWLCIGVSAMVLMIALFALACGGGDEATGPEQTVQDVMAAMEAKDMDAFFAAMDPQGLEQIVAMGVTEEMFKSMLAEEMTYESMKFSDVELSTEMAEDGQTAVVTVVAGEVTTVEDGETTVEDVKDSEDPEVFELILRDGTWYLDMSGMM